MSLNKVMIIGNLGSEPETRFTQSNKAFCNLSVATSEKWSDKQTGERREQTEWHRVVAFGRLAEIMGEYLKKGSKVYIEGRLQTRKWQDKDGQDRWTTEIIVGQFQMLDSKPEGQQQRPADSKPGAVTGPNDPPDDDMGGDDIPFAFAVAPIAGLIGSMLAVASQFTWSI